MRSWWIIFGHNPQTNLPALYTFPAKMTEEQIINVFLELTRHFPHVNHALPFKIIDPAKYFKILMAIEDNGENISGEF